MQRVLDNIHLTPPKIEILHIFARAIAAWNTARAHVCTPVDPQCTTLRLVYLQILSDDVIADVVELEFFGEDVDGHSDGSPESTTRLVIVEHGVEGRPMAVEEVLVANGVVVAVTSVRVAKKGVSVLLQSRPARLESQPADVDDEPVSGHVTSVVVGNRRG